MTNTVTVSVSVSGRLIPSLGLFIEVVVTGALVPCLSIFNSLIIEFDRYSGQEIGFRNLQIGSLTNQ